MKTNLLFAIAAIAGLSGCGLRGDLERPAPLWGTPDLETPASLDENEIQSVFENPFSTPLDDAEDDDGFDDPAKPEPTPTQPTTPEQAPG
jgi:predicted small lipoprotein YifL